MSRKRHEPRHEREGPPPEAALSPSCHLVAHPVGILQAQVVLHERFSPQIDDPQATR